MVLTRPKFLLPAAAALALAGVWLVPKAQEAWTLYSIGDDPLRISALALKQQLTPESLRQQLDAALTEDDIDLADSYMTLAAEQNLIVPVDLLERYRAATTFFAHLGRDVSAFATGAFTGKGEGGIGVAGTITADLTGIGDVRDLVLEGEKYARGEEPDQLLVGLSAAGVVLTGITVASFGSALPARAGVSTVKTVAKTGRLSKPLAATFTRLAGEAIDTKAVTRAAQAAARFDLAAARTTAKGAVRSAKFTALREAAENVATIGSKGGVRTAQESLTLAHSAEDIAKVARLAEARGPATRAILKTLGRGAIIVGAGTATLIGWMAAGVSYGLMALLVAAGLIGFVWRMMLRFVRLMRLMLFRRRVGG